MITCQKRVHNVIERYHIIAKVKKTLYLIVSLLMGPFLDTSLNMHDKRNSSLAKKGQKL